MWREFFFFGKFAHMKTKALLHTSIVLAALTLVGCGGGPEPMLANAQGISIRYNGEAMFSQDKEVYTKAGTHCAQFNKQAVANGVTQHKDGFMIANFRCA
jgi:hypothetical protein